MKTRLQVVPKIALGLLLAAGLGGTVAATAQPAQAGVIVSVGIGGGYAPAPYHWYRWHDGYGWHRQWVRVGWVPPAYAAPVYAYGVPAYGYRPAYPAWPAYGPAYFRRDRDRDRDWHRDHDRYRDGDRRAWR